MDSTFSDFIGHFSNVYEDGFCNHMIEEFERCSSRGLCGNRKRSEGSRSTSKKDDFLFLNMKNIPISSFNNKRSLDIFYDGLQRCFESYTDEYDVLKGINLSANYVKMQRTPPGGGYHDWHCEQAANVDDQPARILVYALYLNTIEPEFAGETEFFYQRKRIHPKENTMVIWPAAYTHTHRGNMLYGEKNKYIITGWFHLI
jgi:hypothetical protein